jgi:hypothetical protein
MLSYFEKFFARIYLFYNKYEDSGMSANYAIWILSLLQAFNVFTIALYLTTWVRGKNYSVNALYLILCLVILMGMNYIWFFNIKGVNKVIQKYSTKESRKPLITPWVYIIFTALFFASIRFLGFWPTGGVINDPLIHSH